MAKISNLNPALITTRYDHDGNPVRFANHPENGLFICLNDLRAVIKAGPAATASNIANYILIKWHVISPERDIWVHNTHTLQSTIDCLICKYHEEGGRDELYFIHAGNTLDDVFEKYGEPKAIKAFVKWFEKEIVPEFKDPEPESRVIPLGGMPKSEGLDEPEAEPEAETPCTPADLEVLFNTSAVRTLNDTEGNSVIYANTPDGVYYDLEALCEQIKARRTPDEILADIIEESECTDRKELKKVACKCIHEGALRTRPYIHESELLDTVKWYGEPSAAARFIMFWEDEDTQESIRCPATPNHPGTDIFAGCEIKAGLSLLEQVLDAINQAHKAELKRASADTRSLENRQSEALAVRSRLSEQYGMALDDINDLEEAHSSYEDKAFQALRSTRRHYSNDLFKIREMVMKAARKFQTALPEDALPR